MNYTRIIQLLPTIALLLAQAACFPKGNPPTVEILGGPQEGKTVNFDSTCFPIMVKDDVSTLPDLWIRTNVDKQGWSDWQNNDMAHCYETSEGHHTFAVQAKDADGNKSSVVTRTFETVLVPCLPINLRHPLTGTPLNIYSWERWDGSMLTYGNLTMAMTTTGEMLISDPHKTVWRFVNQDENWIVVMTSIGHAVPGQSISGIALILSCDGHMFMSEELLHQPWQVANKMFATPIP